MKMIPGGRADKAVKGIKKTVKASAAGGVTGAIASTGAFIDPAMGYAAMKTAHAALPSLGSATLGGLAIGAAIPAAVYVGKKIHHALSKDQFK